MNPNGIADYPQITFRDASGKVAVVGSQQLQVFNTIATCITAPAAGASCTTKEIRLPVAYSDIDYRLACTGLSPTNAPAILMVTKSKKSFTITIVAITAAAATDGSFDCHVVHD